MKHLSPSPFLALALIGTQLLGPTAIWAMEQRGIRVEASKQLIVTGLAGGEVMAGANGDRRALRFRDTVQPGEQLIVPAQATAEVLIGIRALLAAHGPARFAISEEVPGLPVIKLDQGELTLAVAGTVLTQGQAVTIQTPVARTMVRSGIVKTKVESNPNRVSSHVEEKQEIVHRVSFNAEVAAVTKSNLVETIQTFEGSSDVQAMEGGGGGATLKAGDSVQVMSGKIVRKTPLEANTRIEPTVLAAVGSHANTPASGAENLVAGQMGIAGALGQSLVGASETTSGGGNATGNAIVSIIFGANLGSGSGAGSPLAFLFGGGSGGSSGNAGVSGAGGTGGLFGSGGTGGSSLFSSQPNTISTSGAGIIEDNNDAGFDICCIKIGTFAQSFNVPGGNGLLLFDRHHIRAQSELFVVSGGSRDPLPTMDRTLPSHLAIGAPPTRTMVVHGFDNAINPSTQAASPHTALSLLQFLQGVTDFNTRAEIFFPVRNPPTDVRALLLDSLTDYSRDNPRAHDINAGIPEADFGQLPAPVSPCLESCGLRFNNSLHIRLDVNPVGGIRDPNGTFLSFIDPGTGGSSSDFRRSLVDGILRGLSPADGTLAQRAITFNSGVVLHNGTIMESSSQDPVFDPMLPLSLQLPVNATKQYFTETSQVAPVNASLVTIAAKRDSDATLVPAVVNMLDRVLGVVTGSKVQPADAGTNLALLSVLDSRLRGPLTSPINLDTSGPIRFKVNSAGQPIDVNGNPIALTDLQLEQKKVPVSPPLIEILVGNTPPVDFTPDDVRVKSAVVVRATTSLNGLLTNGGLLEIGSSSTPGGPLAFLGNSRMTTTGHFIDLAGAPPSGANLLFANVAGDSLIRVESSRLTVGQDLVNLTNQGSLSVTGNLLNQKGNSILTAASLLNVAGANTRAAITSGSIALLEGSSSASLSASGGHVATVTGGGTLTLTGNGADLKDTASLTVANGQVLNVSGAGSQATVTNGSVALLRGNSTLRIDSGSVASVIGGTVSLVNGNLLDMAGTNTTATMTTGSVLTATGGATNVTGSAALVAGGSTLGLGTNSHVVTVTTGTSAPSPYAAVLQNNVVDVQSGGVVMLGAGGNVLNLTGTGQTANVGGSVVLATGANSRVALANGQVVHLGAGAVAQVGKNVLDLQGATGAAKTVDLTAGNVVNLTAGTSAAAVTKLTVAESVARLRDGSTLNLGNGHVATVNGNNAQLTVTKNVVDLDRTTSAGAAVTLGANGTVLNVAGGTATVGGSVALLKSASTLTLTDSDVARVSQGVVTLTGNVADLDLNASLSTGAGQVLNQSGGTVTVGDGAGVTNVLLLSGGTANVGRVATLTGGSTSVRGNIASVQGGVLTMAGDSLLSTLGGTLTVGQGTTNASGNVTSVTQVGNVLFQNGGTVAFTSTTANLVNIGAGALTTVFGNVASLSNNSALSLAGNLLNVAGNSVATTTFTVAGNVTFLNNASLTLTQGNLLSLSRTAGPGAGSTTALVQGGLFNLINGSTLTLQGTTGVLASVGAGTQLALAGLNGAGPTLGFFGAAGLNNKTNTLELANTLCSGGAVCTTLNGVRILGVGFATEQELKGQITGSTTNFSAFRGPTEAATIKTAGTVFPPAVNSQTALVAIEKTQGTGACTAATCGTLVIK